MSGSEHIGRRRDSSVALVSKFAGLTAPVLILLGMSLSADAATLYRYINEKGYQEIGYSIPPHLVPNGYDVIDESGRLVRRVAPQLSEEEYAVKLERERKLEACEKAIERVHRRYEALADIDVAETVFEEQLQERLQNDQANLEFSQGKLLEQREDAAARERKGEIPKHVLENIRQTELQVQNLAAQMEALFREGENQNALLLYQRYETDPSYPELRSAIPG